MAAVGAAGGILILQAVRLAARWPACCLPARPRAPYGPYGRERACSGRGARAGLLGAVARLVGRETDLIFEIGRYTKYNTKLSLPTLPYLHNTHTYRHTHLPPQGCAMGPPMWPWRCGLTARPVSGVEDPGFLFTPSDTFWLGRTVLPQYKTLQTDRQTDRRHTVP